MGAQEGAFELTRGAFVDGDEEKEWPSFGIFADNDYFCNRFTKKQHTRPLDITYCVGCYCYSGKQQKIIVLLRINLLRLI